MSRRHEMPNGMLPAFIGEIPMPAIKRSFGVDREKTRSFPCTPCLFGVFSHQKPTKKRNLYIPLRHFSVLKEARVARMVSIMKKPYYDTKDDLDEAYKSLDLDSERLIRNEADEFLLTEVQKEVQVKRKAMPRMEDLKVEPLNRATPEIIGSLFDRIKFLKERIAESNEMIETRKKLHEQVIAEIDVDISDKASMESRLTDIDEKRNLKLDISILRKEKRHEQLQFWRDILELKTEMRTLLEEYESESKIVGLFSEGDNHA